MVKRKCLLWTTVCLACVPLIIYFLQHWWAHRKVPFVPDYLDVVLTEGTDYEIFLQQAGLGRQAVDKLLGADDFETILKVQEAFRQPVEISCSPMIGWFTREDRIQKEGMKVLGPELVDLQPGDILLTLSTHSLGWRHGHAALVIDEDTTLECAMLGTDSCYGEIEYWRNCSEYCVLRVKGVTPKLQKEVTEYACSTLHGVPYHLTAGFIGPKAPEPDAGYFGLQCAYLVWYAWNHFGFDLDADGGRLVSTSDLMQSELLEVVQVYGMDWKVINNL